ncbi:MAG: hypothetical protein Q4D77_09235 [Peptostreptococcaceae bacterium]|nr:hypothetical protein [Peptostreptococcaceae bacterium]
MDYSLLNIGSFLLGLISWFFAFRNLSNKKPKDHASRIAHPIISLSSCVLALYFQMLYNWHLATIQDWTAIEDTAGGVLIYALVLVFVTVMLNALSFIRYAEIGKEKATCSLEA